MQDMITVLVLDHRIARELAICAARKHDRDLALKIDEPLDHTA